MRRIMVSKNSSEGNIFNIMAIVVDLLKGDDREKEVRFFTSSVMNAGSYEEAIKVCKTIGYEIVLK